MVKGLTVSGLYLFPIFFYRSIQYSYLFLNKTCYVYTILTVLTSAPKDFDGMKSRRAGLEKFLARVARHPVLSCTKLFHLFLTTKDDKVLLSCFVSLKVFKIFILTFAGMEDWASQQSHQGPQVS